MPTPDIVDALGGACYVTNVACVVRVDGKPVQVPASTRLPEGVQESEIARLLRFNVIRIYVEPTPEPTPEPDPEPTPEVEPEAVVKAPRTRKKSAPALEE